MTDIDRRTRRYFTEAAREGAKAKRREMALNPRDKLALELFVVRLAPSAAAFTWEIRQFGGIILERGETGFPSMRQAYSSGILALAALAPP